MNKALLIIFTLILTSCATYKIEPDNEFNYSQLRNVINEEVLIERTNEYPGGFQCFEPVLFVLTLGIIPQHCVYTYEVTSNKNNIGHVEVTSMQGWVALLVALFPSWQYGYGDNMEEKIRDKLDEFR